LETQQYYELQIDLAGVDSLHFEVNPFSITVKAYRAKSPDWEESSDARFYRREFSFGDIQLQESFPERIVVETPVTHKANHVFYIRLNKDSNAPRCLTVL
jgi:HSP20 family molecular chaperone IbpA